MTIRDVLTGNNPWWFGEYYREHVFRRHLYFDLLEKFERFGSRGIVLVGPRRTGKTVLLKQLVSDICESYGNIAMYVPVDELTLVGVDHPVYESFNWFIRNIHPGGDKIFVVYDEVQYYDGWSLEFKAIIDRFAWQKNSFLIASGSSSLGLIFGTGEGLIGRVNISRIYPMGILETLGLLKKNNDLSKLVHKSRREFYNHLISGDSSKAEKLFSNAQTSLKIRDIDVDKVFHDMLIYGSLPQTVDLKQKGTSVSEIYRSLIEIIDLTIFRDILRLQKFYQSDYRATPNEVQSIIYLIAHRSPFVTTVNNISSLLGIGWRKVKTSLELAEKAGLIGFAKNYAKSIEVRERLRLVKYFARDLGIRNAIRFRLDHRAIDVEEEGRLLENMLLIQLEKILHLYGDPNPQIHFWRKNNYELDAVAILSNKILGFETKKSGRRSPSLKAFKRYIGEGNSVNLLEESDIKYWSLFL